MIRPGRLDLEMFQGATFTYQFTWTADGEPVNVSGFMARMQVRPSVRSEIVELEFVSGDGITLGGETGVIQLSADAVTTELATPGQYVYDLELDSGGEVTRLLEGSFVIVPEVTR